MPFNQNINDVLLKCATLNNFYSTNIFNVYDVAQCILNILNIDERLAKGDMMLVNQIQKVTINSKENNFYSFASKYCSHHNSDEFPIYDSYVDKILLALNKKYQFAKFGSADLKDYQKFKDILIAFK